MVLVAYQPENGLLGGGIHTINASLLAWVFKKAIMQLFNIKWDTGNT